MKKYYVSIFAIAAIAALAVSCAKEDPGIPDNPGVVRFTAQAPQVKTTIENVPESDERIVKWAEDDEIDIFWASGSTTATAESVGEETTFVAASDVPETTCYAVYPSGRSTYEDSVLSVTIPHENVDGSFASANMALARTTDYASRTLNFGNLCALVKFSVANASYTKAVFKGAKGEVIAGTFSVDFSTSPLSLSATDPETQVEVTLSGAGEYYFAIIPTTFSAGYSITLYKEDVADAPATVRNEKVLERAHVYNLKGIDGIGVRVRDYFATPDGAGKKTGKNWENAFDAAALKVFLQQPVDGEGNQINAEANYKAEVLNGATIHMAAGDYDLAGETKIEFNNYGSPVGITFKGGYPAELTGTSVAGRDTTSYRSAFTSSVAGSVITLGNQTNITFEGITFKDASRTANGGALTASASDTGNSMLTLTSCRFINNTNDNGHTGASVFLKKASADISYCYFSGNYARNGSCINLDTGAGEVTISNCLFYKNSTFNTSGALQNGSTKTVTVKDCTFDHNTAGSWGGGAFHINASGASTTFTDCIFRNNSAGQGGAISIENGSATFTSCTFSGNSATKGSKKDADDSDSDVLGAFAGGAIILHNANSVCNLNHCTFTGNSAPKGSGGAIAYENKAATLNINAGTSFSGNTAYNLGGTIFVRGAGKLNINGTSESKVTFTGDHTLATGEQHANGGAIWLGDKSQTTMSYAVFDRCEAGQESGSTVNYSNGGAISIKTANSFQASNCEFKACRGRNGGVLEVELGSGKSATFTDCNFHDNTGRSGAAKTGTSGDFHGGVARFGGSGTTTFNGCQFTDNVAYNGGGTFYMEDGTLTIDGGFVKNGDSVNNAGGMIYMLKGTLNLNNTTVSGCTCANGKKGGAIYVNTGDASGGVVTVNATSTTFSNNKCGNSSSNNEQGGAIRTEGASGKVVTINLSDCLFIGNKANRHGIAISLDQYCFLKANRCVFSGNVGQSRGTVNYGNNSLIFMNNCAFYNNTFSDVITWGLTVHGGGANAGICLNNMTAYNNRCTNGSPHATQNISVNGDTPMLIVNSTILDNTAYLLRANKRTLQFCNNILVNPGTAANIVHSDTPTKTSYGHNAMSGTSGADDDTDLTNCTLSTFTSGAWSSSTSASPYYGVYSWTGGASLADYTPAVEKDITDAIAAYTQAVSAVGVSNAGAAFETWLESLGESGSYGYQVDGRGVPRTGTWWPGAYQNNPVAE